MIRALTPHHSVDLLVVREGEQAYVERQGSVRVLRVPSQDVDARAQIQAFQRALKRQLEGADYDVVHCRDAWCGMTVLEARERLGYAVVYDLSRSPLGESTLDADLDAQHQRDEDACLLAADLVLAPTPAAVHALQGRGRPSRIVLSPPGVDVDRFDWDELPTGGPPRVLYVGAIDPGRGVRVLVRAMAVILREVDCRLVLAGPIARGFDQQLRDGIRELGLVDKIELPGVVDHDQLPALIASATVCVVPHAADVTPQPTVGFPTKLLEYLACRRAVVAPQRDTVAQVVENGRDALLFDPGDPLDLAAKILRVLREPALRERLAASGYERVRREFTASAARRALRNAYALVAERFATQFADGAEDESPKVEMLTDDEFEATVFEDAAPQPPVDTAVQGVRSLAVTAAEALDEALSSLDDGGTSSGIVAAPPPLGDQTAERAPVAPAGHDARGATDTTDTRDARDARDAGESGDSGLWAPAPTSTPPKRDTIRGAVAAPAVADDWIVTNAANVLDREIGDDSGEVGDEGTPAEGSIAIAGPAMVETNFVAGEIDVPTPAPEPIMEPSVDFIAASSMLGPQDPDADTGSRTPPLERR